MLLHVLISFWFLGVTPFIRSDDIILIYFQRKQQCFSNIRISSSSSYCILSPCLTITSRTTNANVPINLDLLGRPQGLWAFPGVLDRWLTEGRPTVFLDLRGLSSLTQQSPADLRQETVRAPFGISPKCWFFPSLSRRSPARDRWASRWSPSGKDESHDRWPFTEVL